MEEKEIKLLIKSAHESERNAIIRIIQSVQKSYGSHNVFDELFYNELQGIIDKIQARKD